MKYEVWRGFGLRDGLWEGMLSCHGQLSPFRTNCHLAQGELFQGASVPGPGLVHFEILLQSLCLLSEIDIHVALSSERPCLLRNASKPAAWN